MTAQKRQRETIQALQERYTDSSGRSDFQRWLGGEAFYNMADGILFTELLLFTFSSIRYVLGAASPNCRPYTASEFMEEWTRRGTGLTRTTEIPLEISSVTPSHVKIQGEPLTQLFQWSYTDILRLCTWPDGAQCGVEQPRSKQRQPVSEAQEHQRATINALCCIYTDDKPVSDFQRWVNGEQLGDPANAFDPWVGSALAFSMPSNRYGIKPASKYRPYTASQFMQAWTRSGSDLLLRDKADRQIASCSMVGAQLRYDHGMQSTTPYETLVRECTWPDGTPCGVEM